MHQRHAFGLERLAEMSGKLVEQAYHRAIVAEEAEAKDRASLVFDRLARGFRLTLSLEARFARDVRREEREIAEGAAEPDSNPLPRPVAAPRPDRPAREPSEADHESEMEAEETSDALAVRARDLSGILDDQADLLDPDGAHRAALAQWWAEGQRYEPGYKPPAPCQPTLRRTRPKSVHRRDAQPLSIPDDDLDAEIDDDLDVDDVIDREPAWLETG